MRRMDAKNGVCTHIGSDWLTASTTTGSKSGLNFLELLNAGDTTHLINDVGLADVRERNLSGTVIGLLAAHTTKPGKRRAMTSTRIPTPPPACPRGA